MFVFGEGCVVCIESLHRSLLIPHLPIQDLAYRYVPLRMTISLFLSRVLSQDPKNQYALLAPRLENSMDSCTYVQMYILWPF